MAGPFAKVPPLRSLIAFEAAARCGTFSAAAEELHMTQAAVSQHVAQLEADMGSPLFDRSRRGVGLTATGALLLRSVEAGLGELAQGAANVRRRSAPKTLHIRTDFGFAGAWLMPRMTALSEALPGVDIQITTSQADPGAHDRDFDLAIVFGRGDWEKCRVTRLCDEEVYPVCSPAYLAGRKLPQSAAQIADMRLLHLNGDNRRRWFEWGDWLKAQGLPVQGPAKGPAYSNFQMVMQAVLMGQGVALGFAPLIDDMLASKQLVALSREPLRSQRGYFIVEPDERAAHPHLHIVRQWLTDAVGRAIVTDTAPCL